MAGLNTLLDLIADAVHRELCHICALKRDDTAQILVCFLPSQYLQFAADIETVCLCTAYGVYDQLFQRMTLVFPGVIAPQKCQFYDLRKIGSHIELSPCHRCFHF